uniref:uncharacterized protein LOC122596550 n=1 Tax=Erigeron canadensis TaxID=72917 RepID=UPI001CB97386|nr:uncharacterized protein LOC122596550 [Erigeron canadensis]
MIGVISEDCGSQFVGTLVSVLVGLIPVAKKRSRIAVDQGKRMLFSPFLDKKVVGTHRPSPCIASARGDASGGVQSGFLCPTLIQDRKLIGCEQITLIQEVSKSVVFKKLHATSKFFSGSSSSSSLSSSSSDDSSYHYLRQHDVCSTLSSTIHCVLDGMIMKPIQNADTNELEEMTTTAVGCHGAAYNLESKDVVEKGSQISFLSKEDVCSTLASTIHCVLDGMIMNPIPNEDTNELEEMTTTASGCHAAANNFGGTDVVEKESQILFFSKGYVSQMISLYESKRSNIVSEKESQKSFFSKGQNYSISTDPLFESEQSNLVFESNSKPGPIESESENSTSIGLSCIQDKKVVGIHRALPYIAPAPGDASGIVQSGFLQPTLTQDGKLIGCENQQGKDKQLTSVMERTRKLHEVDLTRKQEINAVNIHSIVPKGGKPIESQKHKGQKKQLNSVMECRTVTGLVRKQHKQVVGTQRTITGAVPAQGHIPVVRSGCTRPTLIQKDSRSIGSEKLQGSEKLLSSVAQSKKKPGIIDSSKKNHINVVNTRKGLVGERSLQSVSKRKPGNIDPSRKKVMKVVSTRKDLVDERFFQSVSKKNQENIDPSRKNDIKVVGTLKDFVDERSLQCVSKHKNAKTVSRVPSYKGRIISSTSELKPRWNF